MHADHLCSPGETEDENWSSSGSERSSRGEELKVKKLVKRRAKVTRRPADSSDDEEETAQQRLRRRRRVNHVPDLTTLHSEDEVASSGEIIIFSERETNQSETRTKSAAPPAPTLTASDSEDEATISGEIIISSEGETNKLFAKKRTRRGGNEERQILTTGRVEDKGPGVENMGVGSMKGGAGGAYEEMLREAIKKSELNLKLDHPTRGDGNCCARAILQQCQRAPIRLLLQSRKVTFNTIMQLKHNVSTVQVHPGEREHPESAKHAC